MTIKKKVFWISVSIVALLILWFSVDLMCNMPGYKGPKRSVPGCGAQ